MVWCAAGPCYKMAALAGEQLVVWGWGWIGSGSAVGFAAATCLSATHFDECATTLHTNRTPSMVIDSGSYNFCRFSLLQQPASSSNSNSSSDSPLSAKAAALICTPCEDSSTIGIWELASQGYGGSGAARDDYSQPVIRLQQRRPKDAPEHGMVMALHMFSNGSTGVSWPLCSSAVLPYCVGEGQKTVDTYHSLSTLHCVSPTNRLLSSCVAMRMAQSRCGTRGSPHCQWHLIGCTLSL